MKLVEQIAKYISHGLSDEEIVNYLHAVYGTNPMESALVGVIRYLLTQKDV